MAKKNSKSSRTGKKKSSVSSVSPRSYSDMFKDQADSTSLPTSASAGSSAKKADRSSSRASVDLKGSETVAWESEYAYVLNDLRWLIFLSLGLLAAIVVAGFFL